MSDLVKRLLGKCKMLHQCVEMRREAAGEIERLTAERDTAEANLERLQNKFEAVTAENKRLLQNESGKDKI